LTSELPKPGDLVVTMSYLGLFTVVRIDGDTVEIVDDHGTTRVVRLSNVRRVDRPGDPA
jgi:preprotein translocase subunit YajC